MGQVGAAGDNAAMESFFGLLQNNVLDRRRWATRQQLRIAIVTWIERTYHRRRRQASLGRLTPIEYETIMTTPSALSRLTEPVTYSCSRPRSTPRERGLREALRQVLVTRQGVLMSRTKAINELKSLIVVAPEHLRAS